MHATSARAAGRTWLLAVVAICLVPRFALWFVYEPIEYSDTGVYVDLARRLVSGDFRDFDGARTPGYSLLVLLSGENPYAIWALQSIFGIATALLLYALTWQRTSSRIAASLAALGCGLSLNLMFGEATMLTETLASFLLVLGVFLYARYADAARPGAVPSLALGVVLSLAALTRPLMMVLIPVSVVFLIAYRRPARVWPAVLVLLPALVLIGGWSAVVWRATGVFTPTTLLGYNLTQHSGAFFELVPDEDARLRDIYLRARVARIEATGSYSGTIWLAKDEMAMQTGLSSAMLSRELARISVALFATHPVLYLTSVARSWRAFWYSMAMWHLDELRPPQLDWFVQWLWDRQRSLLAVLKIALVPALAMYLSWTTTGRGRSAAEVPLVVLAVIAAASLVQAMIEFGENARYAIPFQPLIIFVVIVAAFDGGKWLAAVLQSSSEEQVSPPIRRLEANAR